VEVVAISVMSAMLVALQCQRRNIETKHPEDYSDKF